MNSKTFWLRKQKWLPEAERNILRRCSAARSGESPLPPGSQQEGEEKQFRHMSQTGRRSSRQSGALSAAERRSQVSRVNRSARYEAVRALHQQAFSDREIARRMKLSRVTVHQFIVAEAFPEISRPPYLGSILDPYKPYILQRWQEGCWNGVQIYTEIKERGYVGSDSLFRFFIRDLRKRSTKRRGPQRSLPWMPLVQQWIFRVTSSQTVSQSAYVSYVCFLAVCEPAEQTQ